MSKDYDTNPMCSEIDCYGDMYYIGGGYWKCNKCGCKEYFGYDDEGDSTEENLSMDEMADIWRSRGMDEDYSFGYDDEELYNA